MYLKLTRHFWHCGATLYCGIVALIFSLERCHYDGCSSSVAPVTSNSKGGNQHSVLTLPDNPQSVFDLAEASSISPCVCTGQGYTPSMPFSTCVCPHSHDFWNHTAAETDHRQLTPGAWDFPPQADVHLWTRDPTALPVLSDHQAGEASALVLLVQRCTCLKLTEFKKLSTWPFIQRKLSERL